MGINIDELNIEVIAKASNAEGALDRLITKLNGLQTSLTKVKGFTKLNNQLNSLTAMSAKLSQMSGLDKINKFVSSINQLNNIQVPNLTKTKNALSSLVSLTISISTLPDITAKISSFTNALKPFETLGKNNVNSFLNSLKKLPEISQQLESVDIDKFADKITKLSTALVPLSNVIGNISTKFYSLPKSMQDTIAKTQKVKEVTEKTSKSYATLGSALASIKTRTIATVYLFSRLKTAMFSWFDKSNEYVENLNLFTVAMGDASEEAMNYAQTVNELLGIDTSEWIRNQGVFKQITTGFGVMNDKANLMSKNLTQIGYDISSFFNIDIEESMQKVQSGISGELEPLRRLGYALDAATLQQIAYDNGIKQNINTMTQAQKSQLRYIAILSQSQNVMGDMARTIVTPANSMRILGQLVTQLQRALGNIISVFAVKLIPYVQAFVKLMAEGANYLADLWGFELPSIDYSSASDGLSTISDEATTASDEIAETVKQMQRLAGFDEINVLQSPDTSSSGAGTDLGSNFDLGIDLPEYDFLAGLDTGSDQIYEKMKAKIKGLIDWWKKYKDIVGQVAKIVATIWAVNKISKFVGMFTGVLSSLKKFVGFKTGVDGTTSALSKFSKVKLTAITSAIGFLAGSDFGKKLATNSLTATNSLLDIASAGGAIAIGFAKGGLLGGAITTVATFAGVITSLYKECKKAKEEADKAYENYLKFEYLYQKVGIPIKDVADEYTKFTETFTTRGTEYKTLSDELTNISDNADTAKTSIEKLFRKFKSSATSITSEDFESLKTAISDLYSYTKDMVDTQVDIITKGITESFGAVTAAAQKANTDLAGEFYLTQSKFNEALATSQQKVDGYVSKLESLANSDGVNTKAYQDTFKQLTEELSKLATLDDSSFSLEDYSRRITGAFKDLGTIDLGNDTALTEFLTDISDKYSEAANSIDESYYTQMDALDRTRQYWDAFEIPYDPKMFTDAAEKYKSDRDALLKNLQDSTNNITGQVKLQLDTAWQNSYDDYLSNDKDYSFYKSELKNNVKGTQEYKYIEDIIKDKESEAKKIANNVLSDAYKAYETLPSDIQSKAKAMDSYKTYSTSTKVINSQYDVEEAGKAGTAMGNNLVKGLNSAIKGATATTQDTIKSFVNNATSTASIGTNDRGQSLGKSIANGTKTGISGKGAEILNSLKAMVTNGTNTKSLDTYNNGKTAGISIGNGAIGGINSKISIVQGAIKGMFNNINVKSSGATTSTTFISGAVDTLLSALEKAFPKSSVSYKLISQTLNAVKSVKGYATGGYPTKGEIFMANENGAEFVGSIGGKTAVANDTQIETAIYRAVKEAMAGNSVGQGQTTVENYLYIDGDDVSYALEKKTKTTNKRTNGGGI